MSKALQTKNTTIQEALSAAGMAKSFIRRQREDNAFESFYSSCVTASEKLTEEPSLLCYRRPPKRIDEGSEPHHFNTPKEYFRRQYFEVMDFVSDEIDRRFDQQSFILPIAIEDLLLKACAENSDDVSITVPEIITKSYSLEISQKA